MVEINTPIIFSVGCEKDRKLKEEWIPMEYEHGIQAGAALSDKIIYEYRDDAGNDNISDRNRRYCEFSAIYWIWKNIRAPYIGICHYRRKFNLTKNDIDVMINDGVEIISTIPNRYNVSTKTLYCYEHYKCDWDLFMAILQEKSPEAFEKCQEVYNWNNMHIASMGIYKYELFDEMCSWIFPILDEFCRRSPVKFSVYQHRDVAFIGERLVSLFFEMKKDVCKNHETDFCFLDTEDASNLNGKNDSDIDEKIYKQFMDHKIDECVKDYIRTEDKTEFMLRAGVLLTIYKDEMRTIPKTYFEYGDEGGDLDKQLKKLDNMGSIISRYVNNASEKEQIENIIIDLLRNNIYSYIYIKDVMEIMGVLSPERLQSLLRLVEKAYGQS